MKKILLLLLILIKIISCTQNRTKDSNYSFSIDTINFDKMKFEDTLKKTVYIVNKLDSNLIITGIETACGCTTAKLKDTIVKRNDSIPMQITYTPSYSNDKGKIIKYITIRTNAKPNFKNLILKGEVLK